MKAAAQAGLPAGYSIENYYPPKDNYGRDQLFEALGLAVAKDGTIVVATRTAGIWRIVNGEWRLFAEGLFDSLGVVVEDGKGLTVVAGQKAELTRISDTNGDGIADNYETLFDAHSYHANYHSYMHGPVRGKDGVLLLRAQPRARRHRQRVHRRRQCHGHVGRLQRLGRARDARRQVRAVCQRPAQSGEPRRGPRRARLVRRQPGRLRRHVEAVRAAEGCASTAIPPASSTCLA